MTDTKILASSDLFFYYGENSSTLNTEIESDIVLGLMESRRALFYDRSDGAGVSEYENNPNGFVLQIQAKFDVVKWASFRNSVVSDGSGDLPDRRVAISQNSIAIRGNQSEIDMDVSYIPFSNYKTVNNISIPFSKI